MAVTYIERLTGREALDLHRNFAHFAEGHSVALVTTEGAKPVFLDRQYKDMNTLTDHVNARLHGSAPAEIVGFSGPTVLSLHFSNSAFETFRNDVVKARTLNNLSAQVPNCSEYMLLAIAQWGNRVNEHRHRCGQPLLRLQELGDKERNVVIIMPNLDTLKEFELRMSNGLFAHEARELEMQAAGVKLEQHIA